MIVKNARDAIRQEFGDRDVARAGFLLVESSHANTNIPVEQLKKILPRVPAQLFGRALTFFVYALIITGIYCTMNLLVDKYTLSVVLSQMAAWSLIGSGLSQLYKRWFT